MSALRPTLVRMTSNEAPVVSTHGLVKDFGSNRAVDHIDLEVKRGEIVGLLGPNGAGKTTTLRMLATLLPITAGTATVFGHDVAHHPHQVRQLIGLTGQYASVDEDLSARENLQMFGRLEGLRGKAANARAEELLEEFSLTDTADRKISNYSGGMRRRLDLSVSLITRPPLIFLDEPTTGLDPRTRNQMWETIRRLVADGATILLTTQYLEEADQLADRIVVIDHGKVVAEGTPEHLKASIGGSTLLVDLADARDPDSARDVLTRVLETPAFVKGTRATASLSDANRAIDALAALRSAGIDVASLQVSQPTLDEVFLALTGEHVSSGDDGTLGDDGDGDGGGGGGTLDGAAGASHSPTSEEISR